MAYQTLTIDPDSISETGGFEVAQTAAEDGSVQTRLLNQNPGLRYQFKSTVLSKAAAKVFRDFWVARHGAYEPFYVVNSVTDESQQVRFVGGSWKTSFQSGYHNVEFQYEADYS